MKLSDKLSELNHKRYVEFRDNPQKKDSKPAIFAFNGDVYDGLNIKSFTKEQIYFAQKNKVSYQVFKPNVKITKIKSYAHNFKPKS